MNELEQRIIDEFSRFNDIKPILEPYKDNDNIAFDRCRPDIAIEYGNRPFALIECRRNNGRENRRDIISLFNHYRKNFTIKCYIANINGVYFYYDEEKGEKKLKNHKEIFAILMSALTESEEVVDKDLYINYFINHFVDQRFEQLTKFTELFKENLKRPDTELKRHGNYIFFSQETEIRMMTSLLVASRANYKENELCRYMQAESFFECLKNQSFRLNSIEAMNDELETKVIKNCKKLNKELSSVNNALYNGFIMCFSDSDRMDKLYNWYMYGGEAKGICFSIKRKPINESNNDERYLYAPICYIKEKEKGRTLLDFLEEIMDIKLDSLSFKLRMWHYWKYFFKYDFYEEEMETRLLFLTKEEGIPKWSEKYQMPYRYVEKMNNEVPFEITNVILGPKFGDNEFAKDVFSNLFENEKVRIRKSNIKGFRG